VDSALGTVHLDKQPENLCNYQSVIATLVIQILTTHSSGNYRGDIWNWICVTGYLWIVLNLSHSYLKTTCFGSFT